MNPKTVAFNATITVVQEGSEADNAGGLDINEIRGFNGNRIQITYTPASGFATTKIILVDNVKPTLVTTSPDVPLVVKGGVNITFSADLTDGGSGYTGTVGTAADGRWH